MEDLTDADKARVIAGFLEWSGGALVCETEDMIERYVEVAMPSDLDAEAVSDYLFEAADEGL